MGLSVVHGIVSSLGGGIAMHSKAGEGTAFEVYFPAEAEKFTSDVRQERPETRGTARILLVDDEEALTDLGRQMLEAAGIPLWSKRTRTVSRRLNCSGGMSPASISS